MKESFDVIVIGSGIGGLSAAALAANAGYKTLVVERLPQVGGRSSSTWYRGFNISTGPTMMAIDGPIGEVFKEIKVDFPVRASPPELYYRIRGKNIVSLPKGGLRYVVCQCADSDQEADKVMDALRKAMSWYEPSYSISFRAWLKQFTLNPRIHGLFQGLIASMHTINSDELPAGEMIRYLKTMAPIRKFGYPPGGFISIMEALAKKVKDCGGQVRVRTRVKKIASEKGRIKGVFVIKDGKETEVGARVVISNAGPRLTVELAGRENFDKAYLKHLYESPGPSPLIWITLASERPLIENTGTLIPTEARRINLLHCPTLTCPEVAPRGKHFLDAGGAPLSSSAPFNILKEIELNLQDLKELLPHFDKAEILAMRTYHGAWPAYRAWPGHDMPQRTSIENLYNVGDGAKPSGWAGMPASAESARIVIEDVKKRIRPGEAS